MSSIVELFATSPRTLLTTLSAKLFNDAVVAGYADSLASSMNIAAVAMGGGPAIGMMLSHSLIPHDTVRTILMNPNITVHGLQKIMYGMVDAGAFDKLLYVITYGASDYSVTASTTLTTGVNRYGTLSIASGTTLTLGAGPGVIIADTVSNSGTIASGWVKGSGGSTVSGAGAGGAGRGAVIILARSITVGTITANGVAGGDGSTVTASASGAAGGAGNFWLISGDSVPSGGNGGGPPGYGRPNGGGGGGGLSAYGYYGGDGGTATTTSFPSILSLLQEILKAVVDWWLVNIVGKTPSTIKTFPSLGGSGGGGAAAADNYGAGGGGGGGAGQIIIYGTSVTAGTVQAKGGAGGAGGTEGSRDAGGGGGGGGIIYVSYKSLTGTFTYDVSGGAGGTGDPTLSGTAGGAGVFRAIPV
jgi:hypothetical protein